jgi:hypothetical protein
MNCPISHERIRSLLEETGSAYDMTVESGDQPNTDFAGYAAQALHEFRSALKRPDLTHDDLAGLLRGAFSTTRVRRRKDPQWSSFMAEYISVSVNQNLQDGYLSSRQ